jgi:uncharacterized protein YbcI
MVLKRNYVVRNLLLLTMLIFATLGFIYQSSLQILPENTVEDNFQGDPPEEKESRARTAGILDGGKDRSHHDYVVDDPRIHRLVSKYLDFLFGVASRSIKIYHVDDLFLIRTEKIATKAEKNLLTSGEKVSDNHLVEAVKTRMVECSENALKRLIAEQLRLSLGVTHVSYDFPTDELMLIFNIEGADGRYV